MIPKKPAPRLMRGGRRFPACAKPGIVPAVWIGASAGVGRSEKIMLEQKSQSGMMIRKKSSRYSVPGYFEQQRGS
jgi:hypothetical protein